MPRYMPQEVFNLCAVTTAKMSAMTGAAIEGYALKMADAHRTYADDPIYLAADIESSAEKIISFLSSLFPKEVIPGACTQLQYCIKHFCTDGSKKRRRIFGGSLFNYERSEISNKVKQCTTTIATYHAAVVSGLIPLTPDGWTL